MPQFSKRFAFLVMEEHPYGREMLSQILDAGLQPELIVQECSASATTEREKFLRRIEGHRVARSMNRMAEDYDVPLIDVERHDDEHSLSTVLDAAPDLIVLGGTRIIRGGLLDAAPDGVLNCHPGLLPDCRGSASPAWSVYHDIPIGSSCHFCSRAIDEGDLVGRRVLPVRRGERYEDLCYRTLVLSGTLMVEALRAWHDDRLEALRQPQGPSPHPTFRNMPEKLLEVVSRKLREQTYAHYAD